jgi:hypothetical protein
LKIAECSSICRNWLGVLLLSPHNTLVFPSICGHITSEIVQFLIFRHALASAALFSERKRGSVGFKT